MIFKDEQELLQSELIKSTKKTVENLLTILKNDKLEIYQNNKEHDTNVILFLVSCVGGMIIQVYTDILEMTKNMPENKTQEILRKHLFKSLDYIKETIFPN